MAVLGREAGADPREAGVVLVGTGEVPKDIKMATNTRDQPSLSPGDAKLKRSTVIEMIEKKIDDLRKEKDLNTHGTVFFGTTAGFSGMLANLIFRHCFKVKQDGLKMYAS